MSGDWVSIFGHFVFIESNFHIDHEPLYFCCGNSNELIQPHMAQKPLLRAEVHVRALRASQNVKESRRHGWARYVPEEWAGMGECGSGRHSCEVA